MGSLLEPYKDHQGPRLKVHARPGASAPGQEGYRMTEKKAPRGPKARLAARLASGAKRVCKTSDCSTILSVYNDDDICSHCFDAIPVNERPYKYRAL